MLNQVASELNALKNSVTFAMSLGSKELFHTNFIAFLLENTDASLFNIRNQLAQLFFGQPINNTKIYTWREKHNLDLVIIAIDWDKNQSKDDDCDLSGVIKNAYVCVIEAKLKSIPTNAQLQGYDHKLAKKNGLNFDLNDSDYTQTLAGKITGFNLKYGPKSHSSLTPVFIKTKGKVVTPIIFDRILLSQTSLPNCNWTQLTWCKLASTVQINLQIPPTSKLDFIVEDYVYHLDNLACLITKVIAYSQNNFSVSNNKFKYGDLCRDINHQNFKKIRIHDLVGKVIFNDLENRLLNSINQPCLGSILEFRSYTHYSNQQAGIGFEWQYGDPTGQNFSIGVQIQGSDYRHYISTSNAWSGLKGISSSLSKWFYPQFNNNCPYQLTGKNNNDLYKFGKDKFIYSKKNIDDLNFDGLSNCLKDSMKLACVMMSNPTLIQQINDDYLT